MDLDDLDAPSQVPSRVSRFAPKSSKLKPKPKSESESLGSVLSKRETDDQAAPKAEPQEFEVKKKEEEIEAAPKSENGFVKMEVDSAAEAKEEPEEKDYMQVVEEEDVVVREIDVFFNPKIDEDTQLYVLQYPLRPCWRPYELDERCEEVRVKPATFEVEINLSMDVESKNYDQDCGSKLKMTKQTLRCSWDQPRATRYAVGVLIGNKLHLNPVHAIVQLRSSLKHLSSGGSKKNGNVAADTENAIKSEESSSKKAVGPSKKQIKQQNSSMKQKIADEECWVPLKYHGSDTDFSLRYLQKMAAQESKPLQFTMTPYDYLNSLCPKSYKNDNEPKGPSRRVLLSLPLEERIKSLLCEGPAPIHRFSFLKHFAPDCTMEEVLDVLQQHALLVQGLWAPKSSLLLGPSKEAGSQRIARDYVLHLFWKKPVISFSSLLCPPSLKTAVNKFLDILGVERPPVKGWKFRNQTDISTPSVKEWKLKEQTDISFIKRYPDVVQKQEQVWGDLERYIMNMFGDIKPGRGAKNANIPSRPVKPLNADKGGTKGVSEVAVSGKIIPDDIREALRSKVLPRVIQEHKVCRFQLICQGLRDLALNKLSLPKWDARFVKAAACGTESPDELKKLVDEIAINIHGLYVLKSSPEHLQYDAFRNIVIDLLHLNGPGAKLKKAEIFEAAKKALNRDITSKEYSKVMNEICVFKGSRWMLKSGDGNPK